MSIFQNKSLQDSTRLRCKDIDFFLELINFDPDAEKNVRIIIEESKRLPAALKGHHGGYRGGLFDHILLVTNIAYQIYLDQLYGEEILKKFGISDLEDYSGIKVEKVVMAAIYHDFGKVPYFLYRKGCLNRKVLTLKLERDAIHEEIIARFGYNGNDVHVEECIAVLKKFNLPFDDEIYQAIIFHHGRYAKYRPINSNKLGNLIHAADTIASRQFKI